MNSSAQTVSVLGIGYLGTTFAVCMAELGNEVIGVDVDEAKVAKLASGELPFHEPGLAELLESNMEAGRIRLTTSYELAGRAADLHFLCVGTPQCGDGYAADLSCVRAAITALAPHLDRRCLVVGRSTVPAGTGHSISRWLRDHAPAGDQVEVAWNPEFLREGFGVHDTLHPDRLVFGVRSAWAQGRLRAIYAPLIADGCPVVVTDLPTAELAKMAANAFLATKVSFANAIADLCAVSGASARQLAAVLGYDARIGPHYLRAGCGFGGGCLPKDLRSLIAVAQGAGLRTTADLFRGVEQVNVRARQRLAALVTTAAGGLAGTRIAVLGAAFKPDTDDVRDSPALDVAQLLADGGADVRVYDPAARENARQVCPELIYAASAADAMVAADVVVVLTEWAEFQALNPADVAQAVRRPLIVDGRQCLDPASWRAAGWTYVGIDEAVGPRSHRSKPAPADSSPSP